MRGPERELRNRMAEALKQQAHSIVNEWVGVIAARLEVGRRDVLPTDTLLDHIPECLEAIAEHVGRAEAGFPTDLVRGRIGDLVQLRRAQGANVPGLLAEYDVLASLLQEWIERSMVEVNGGADADVVAAVVGELKEAFARFGLETARAYRIWTSRELRERALQSTTFADMLRHELRNQLGSAQTAAELLAEDGMDPERRTRLANLISRSVEQALGTVDVVQQVMAQNRFDSELGWLPLADLVNVTLSDRNPAGPRIDLDPDRVPDVHIPGSRVSMVLLNLVDNALKYHDGTKEDPWVRIDAEETGLGDDESGWVRITVRDNGRGIEPTLQQSIFEFAVRGDESESGSGLGLALSRDIVTQLGGVIELESEPGAGTAVSFVVPAHRPHPSPNDLLA